MNCYEGEVFVNFLAPIGITFSIIFTCFLLFKLLEAFRVFVIAQLFRPNVKQFGKWAVVTGATDGIGKAYAQQLAKRGMDIVLISRNLEKLRATAQEFEKEYCVETKIIQADFSGGLHIYPIIREELKGMEIGLVLNNVGTLSKQPCLFLELSNSEIVQLINMNMVSVLMVTYIILPSMLQRKRGCVVNVSSFASKLPVPLKAPYSASKAFVTNLTQALLGEYRNFNIVMQSLIPSYISTKLVTFSDYLQRPSLLVPNATQYAATAINTLTKTEISTGFWTHGLYCTICEHLPSSVWNLMSRIVQRNIDSRKRK